MVILIDYPVNASGYSQSFDVGPKTGLSSGDIADINLARWGHPLVLAQPGQLSSGRMEELSAPLGRVVFAHQDRYGVPAIENAIAAAFAACEELGSKS